MSDHIIIEQIRNLKDLFGVAGIVPADHRDIFFCVQDIEAEARQLLRDLEVEKTRARARARR